MSPLQDKLYWREWGVLVRHCKRSNLPEPDRHELHATALGADKSHKDFSNEEFDKVLAAFRALSQPNNIDAQLRQMEQPKIRLIWKIKQLAKEPYWSKIAINRFGTTDLDSLTEAQLIQLRNTLTARANSRRRSNVKGFVVSEVVTREADPF